jgi:phage gpG-like protein
MSGLPLSKKLRRRLQNFKSGKRSLVADILTESHLFFDGNFKQERFRDIGTRARWKKLKKPRKDGTTRPILQDTGKMRRDVSHRVFSANSGALFYRAHYASYHNDGNPKTNLPQRQFASHSEQLEKKVDKIIVAYIKKKLR